MVTLLVVRENEFLTIQIMTNYILKINIYLLKFKFIYFN